MQISFGSLFWPAKSPEKVWAVVDVLIELDVPFVSSQDAYIPEHEP